MKLLIVGTLLAVASTLKADKEHNNIFESCTGGCGPKRYCVTEGPLWNYCADCCYYSGGVQCYECDWSYIILSFINFSLVHNSLNLHYAIHSYTKSSTNLEINRDFWFTSYIYNQTLLILCNLNFLSENNTFLNFSYL